MSSYLSFYLVPKKSKKVYNYDNDGEHTEKEIELSTGIPLLLFSFSRSSDLYQAFNDTLHPAYAGMEEKYTELTTDGCKEVMDDIRNEIEDTKKRLNTDYKMLKESGYSSELYEDIHSWENYVTERESLLESVKNIYDIVYECAEGYNNFEKVLINVD